MSESRAPLVTVITPCYNAAPFVGETIRSVRDQGHPAIEHIIVDDCSTDGSWEVISAEADRVRAVRLEENRGGGYARNHGAGLARGDYLMFLDADDTIAPDTIGALVAAAERAPGGIAFCDWARLRHQGGAWEVEPRELPLPAPDYDPLRGWLEGVWVPPCSILWSRDCYDRTGGWDESLRVNQDGDIMMRALVDGAILVRAEGGCGYYRDHGAARLSVSGTTFSESQFESLVRVVKKIATALEARGKLDEYLESIGVAYQRLALRAAGQGNYQAAREYAARGERYAGRPAISRTRAGRLLTWLLGIERKERFVNALAERGIATKARRKSLQLQRRYAGEGNGAGREGL